MKSFEFVVKQESKKMETTKSYGVITHGHGYVQNKQIPYNRKPYKRKKLTQRQKERLAKRKEELEELMAKAGSKRKQKKYKPALRAAEKLLERGYF